MGICKNTHVLLDLGVSCTQYYKHFCALTVQATSEVGSAGLYLEDYFEEQLKEVYPDRIFPGGREEHMIPPLEDEIDEEEEEMMAQGTAPVEDEKTQSPTHKGVPPVEEDKAVAAAEKQKPDTEKETDMRDNETDKMVKSEGHTPPAGDVEQCETAPEQVLKDSSGAQNETKDGEDPSAPKEENLPPPTDKTADAPEAQKEESAPADTATEEA